MNEKICTETPWHCSRARNLWCFIFKIEKLQEVEYFIFWALFRQITRLFFLNFEGLVLVIEKVLKIGH